MTLSLITAPSLTWLQCRHGLDCFGGLACPLLSDVSSFLQLSSALACVGEPPPALLLMLTTHSCRFGKWYFLYLCGDTKRSGRLSAFPQHVPFCCLAQRGGIPPSLCVGRHPSDAAKRPPQLCVCTIPKGPCQSVKCCITRGYYHSNKLFYSNLCFMHLGPLKNLVLFILFWLLWPHAVSSGRGIVSSLPACLQLSQVAVVIGQVARRESVGQGKSGHLFFCMSEISAWFLVEAEGWPCTGRIVSLLQA